MTHETKDLIRARDALKRVRAYKDGEPQSIMPYDFFFGDPKNQPNCGHFELIERLLDKALTAPPSVPASGMDVDVEKLRADCHDAVGPIDGEYYIVNKVVDYLASRNLLATSAPVVPEDYKAALQAIQIIRGLAGTPTEGWLSKQELQKSLAEIVSGWPDVPPPPAREQGEG